MHVIIAGCGRVGAALATGLDSDGHDVVIVDRVAAAFQRLGAEYRGRIIQGVAFDRSVLEQAGVRQAQAFVAVTNGDNSNIVSARTAKERFGVERVVARIYDPERAVIYERFGITAIASARWTAEAVLRVLLPTDERVDADVGAVPGEVVLLRVSVPPGVHGLAAASFNRDGESVLVGITRGTSTRLPVQGAVLEAGDEVHLAVERASMDAVRERVRELGA